MSFGEWLKRELDLENGIKIHEILRNAYEEFKDNYPDLNRALPYASATTLGATGIGLYLASKQEENRQEKDSYDVGPFSKRLLAYLMFAGSIGSLYLGLRRDYIKKG